MTTLQNKCDAGRIFWLPQLSPLEKTPSSKLSHAWWIFAIASAGWEQRVGSTPRRWTVTHPTQLLYGTCLIASNLALRTLTLQSKWLTHSQVGFRPVKWISSQAYRFIQRRYFQYKVWTKILDLSFSHQWVKSAVFCGIKPYSSENSRSFGRTYPFHLHGRRSCWFLTWITFWSWWWRWYIHPKHRAFSKLHGVTTQKPVFCSQNVTCKHIVTELPKAC
jgi:hypothetical protein